MDRCLDELGAFSVSDGTRDALVRFAEEGGHARERVEHLLRMAVSSREFQLA